jgi:hypothetical protein
MPFLLACFATTAWLGLCVAAQGYFVWQWLHGSANPLRNEALIGIALAGFYAWPAGIAWALLRWRYWDSVPHTLRVASTSLLAAVATVLLASGLVT